MSRQPLTDEQKAASRSLWEATMAVGKLLYATPSTEITLDRLAEMDKLIDAAAEAGLAAFGDPRSAPGLGEKNP